ncbi:uncharacterized protein [Dysidea avara]|uniref:uncharacterized protein n=1 Tax=Dysidea avara TaxID=196820 RepID=UPI003324D84C
MAETDADVHSEGDEQRCYGEESAGNLCETEEVHYEILTMLARGNVINYIVPSFPIFNTDIVEVKLQWEEICEDGSSKLHVFDRFTRYCENLDHPLPAAMCIEQRYVCAFMIEATEFSRSVDITPYKFYNGHEVFVLWKWTWLDDTVTSDSDPSLSPCLSPTADISSNTEEDDSVPEITHSVVFKCIGVHKDMEYQDTLALASRNKNDGKTVSVKLKPEPDNPHDTNAVAFMCQADEGAEWKRIGYVVREAASEVLGVINAKKIINVRFRWIKFLPYFKNRGWYAGIIITRNGEWSRQVLRSRATDYD